MKRILFICLIFISSNIFAGYNYHWQWEQQHPTRSSINQIAYLNELILTLKVDGNWTLLDRIWIMAVATSDQALVSLVNPTSTKLTLVNSPTFTTKEGFAGNGSTSYINTGYNTSLSSAQFTLNSNTCAIYSRTIGAAASSQYELGQGNGSTSAYAILIRETSLGIFTYNFNGVSLAKANTASHGFYSSVRTASNAISIWKDGISQNTGTTASVALINNSVYVCCYNANGTASNYSTKQISVICFGSGTINQLKLYNAIQAYMTKIGKQI